MNLRHLFDRGRRRLRHLLHRAELEREMDEEMRFHLEMEIHDGVARGMTPEAARLAALRDFGEAGRHKEDARRELGLRLWDDLVQDARFTARTLARRPAFTAVAALTLAVGIGTTTAVFSLANWILLRPVPGVRSPDDLVVVRFQQDALQGGISLTNLDDLREGAPALSALAGIARVSLQSRIAGGAAREIDGEVVTDDYFELLGAPPFRGRYLLPEELGATGGIHAVIVSHHLWRTVFASAPDIVGSRFGLNGSDFTVVGVAPESFRGFQRFGETDVWLAPSAYPHLYHQPELDVAERRVTLFSDLVGRVRPSASVAAVEEQLQRGADRLVESFPVENAIYAELRPTVFEGVGLPAHARQHIGTTLRLLLRIVMLVLVIACANVANLLLFRAVHRRGEMAMRRALGGSAGRLLRQHVVEGTALSLLGAGAGLLLALALGRMLQGRVFLGLPAIEQIGIDWRVLGFGLLIALATGPVFGSIPLLGAAGSEVLPRLKGASRATTGKGSGLRAAFTVVQIAASIVLLVAALLLTRTLQNLQRVDPGFDADGLLLFALDPRPQGYSDERVRGLRQQIVDAAGQDNRIESVSISATIPFSGVSATFRYATDADPDRPSIQVETFFISPEYFRTLRIPLLSGRTLTSAEANIAGGAAAGEAVVLSRETALRLFGDVNAVGKPMVVRGFRESTAATVVGVVEDVRTFELRDEPGPAVYRPIAAAWSPSMWVAVRTALPRAQAEVAVRDIVERIDPALPFRTVELLSEGIQQGISEEILFARLLRLLALLATGLAAVGLYALVSYSVAQRTREIGIRIAVGARSGSVMRLVSRQSAALVAVGTVLGWLGAVTMSRVLASRLFGVEPLSPPAYLLAAAALLLVAVIASVVPAHAATRVDPVRALRAE
jgi:predicted permease